MAEAIVPSLPNHLTKRIRSACDRCHSQKLRCRKLPDSGQCARCSKAQTQCIFSPANRGFRSNPEAGRVVQTGGVPVIGSTSSSFSEPEERREISTNSSRGADPSANQCDIPIENNYTAAFDIRNDSGNDIFTQFEASIADDPHTILPDLNDFDFGYLDFGLADDLSQTNAPLPSSYTQTSPMNNSLTPSINSSIPSITPLLAAGLYIHRLTGLSANLYENAATLIPPGYSPNNALEHSSKYCKPDGSNFPIDQTFLHTQTLLQIMDEIFPRPRSSVPLDTAFTVSNVNEQMKFQHLVLDPATMLLVLSCYIRLVDIYDTLFEHIQNCVINIGRNPCSTDVQPTTNEVVKSVQVGSYNAESPQTASLAILNIVLALSRQLLDRMRGIAGMMGYPDGRDAFVSGTGHAEVTVTVFKSAEKRTHEASEKFNSVRTQLFHLGVL